MKKKKIILILVITINVISIYFYSKISASVPVTVNNNISENQKKSHLNIKINYKFLQPLTEEERLDFTNSLRININTALKDELREIKGVGPSTAERIIKYRRENGPFYTIEDLKNVSGIGPKKFQRLKEFITVGDIKIIKKKRNNKQHQNYRRVRINKKNRNEKIDLNYDSVERLSELPHIGLKTAQRIIDYREENDGFDSIDEIVNVKRIGNALFEKIKDKVKVTRYSSNKILRLKKKYKGKINLNNANYIELRKLPYLTPDLANQIIEFAQDKGFRRVSDLRKIRDLRRYYYKIKKYFYIK